MDLDIQHITASLLFDMPRVKTEVGIVFGGATGNEKLADTAAELFYEGKIDYVIVSGGNYASAHFPLWLEFQALNAELLKRGIPSSCVGVESTATNTEENIRFSLPLGLKAAQSITAICRTPHQRRVLMTMRKFLPDTPITTATYLPGSETGIRPRDWPHTQHLRGFMLKEYAKVVQPGENGLPDYVTKGYCVPIDLRAERARLARLPRAPQFIKIPA